MMMVLECVTWVLHLLCLYPSDNGVGVIGRNWLRNKTPNQFHNATRSNRQRNKKSAVARDVYRMITSSSLSRCGCKIMSGGVRSRERHETAQLAIEAISERGERAMASTLQPDTLEKLVHSRVRPFSWLLDEVPALWFINDSSSSSVLQTHKPPNP